MVLTDPGAELRSGRGRGSFLSEALLGQVCKQWLSCLGGCQGESFLGREAGLDPLSHCVTPLGLSWACLGRQGGTLAGRPLFFMGTSVMGYGSSCCLLGCEEAEWHELWSKVLCGLELRHVAGHPWLGVGWQLTTAVSSPHLLAEKTSLPMSTFFELVGTWGMSLTEISAPVINTPALLICL